MELVVCIPEDLAHWDRQGPYIYLSRQVITHVRGMLNVCVVRPVVDNGPLCLLLEYMMRSFLCNVSEHLSCTVRTARPVVHFVTSNPYDVGT